MNKIAYVSVSFLLLFAGCSSKQYYEPKDTVSFEQKTKHLASPIINLNNDGASLEDNSFISKKGIFKGLQEGYRFLNYSEDTLIATDNNGSLSIKDPLTENSFQFDKNIISASKKDTLLAFGSIDNSITLYDMQTQKTLFKEYLKHSSLNNVKIANPIFLDNIVLFPTLDGKVVIVDLNKKVIVKTINIDPKSDINNIIFLQEIDNSLIAASSKKLFTFVDGKANIKDLDILQIIIKDEFIYVATLDGQVIKYNISLQQIASQKFKFAKINALAYGKYLYALESQDYLIEISDDFKNVKIYDFSFDEEEKIFAIENKLYFEDEYIELK